MFKVSVVFHVERFGNRPIGHISGMNIHSVGDRSQLPGGLFDAKTSQLGDPRQRDVAKSEGAGPPHGARHVGDALMHHFFLDVGGIAVSCRSTRCDTSALVDGYVDDDAAWFHLLQFLAADEAGGLGSWNQDRTDHEIR